MIPAIIKKILKEVENTDFSVSIPLPFPISKVRNLCVPDEIRLLRIENIAITPPTTLYKPKSETPKVSRTTLAVYNDINIENNILPYKKRVFFAIRLLFTTVSDIDKIFYAPFYREFI